MGEQGVAWMKRSGIQGASAKTPGLHPGYKRDKDPENHCVRLLASKPNGKRFIHSRPESERRSVRYAHENSGVQRRRAHSARYPECSNLMHLDLESGMLGNHTTELPICHSDTALVIDKDREAYYSGFPINLSSFSSPACFHRLA